MVIFIVDIQYCHQKEFLKVPSNMLNHSQKENGQFGLFAQEWDPSGLAWVIFFYN